MCYGGRKDAGRRKRSTCATEEGRMQEEGRGARGLRSRGVGASFHSKQPSDTGSCVLAVCMQSWIHRQSSGVQAVRVCVCALTAEGWLHQRAYRRSRGGQRGARGQRLQCRRRRIAHAVASGRAGGHRGGSLSAPEPMKGYSGARCGGASRRAIRRQSAHWDSRAWGGLVGS